MKFIWEENDIEPGRRINNSSGNGELIIGYRYDDSRQSQPAIITVVSLDDGLEVFHATLAERGTNILAAGSRMVVGQNIEIITARAQIAEWLNQSKATPKTIGLR